MNIFLLWFTRIWLLEFAFEPTSKPPNGIRKVISKAFTDTLRGFSLSKDNEWMWGYSENQIMYSPYCYCFCPVFIFVNSVHTGIVTIKPRKCGKGGWTFSTSHGADFSLALELVKGSFATCGQSGSSYPSLFQKPHSIIECECWKSPQQSGQSFHFIDGETGAKENKGLAQYWDNERWEQGQNPGLFNSQSSVLSLPGATSSCSQMAWSESWQEGWQKGSLYRWEKPGAAGK